MMTDPALMDASKPETLRPALAYALRAIASLCLECAGGASAEVYSCRNKQCPLYNLRMGRVSAQAQAAILRMQPDAPVNAPIVGHAEIARLRLSKGLCARCGVNPPMPHCRVCAECDAIRKTAYCYNYYHYRKNSRLCVACGAALEPDDGSICKPCKAKRREYMRTVYARKKNAANAPSAIKHPSVDTMQEEISNGEE